MRYKNSDDNRYRVQFMRSTEELMDQLIDPVVSLMNEEVIDMSVNGRFNNTDCLPVTGKDGKTQWIFKLEDLREVVPEDVYEAIEGFTEAVKDEAVDEFLENWEKEAEVAADGYLSLLRTTREDLEDVISKGEAGLGKKEILIKLKRIRQNINNNL